jgi:hypothetical protein
MCLQRRRLAVLARPMFAAMTMITRKTTRLGGASAGARG